jgi:hypothetical protein
MAVIAAVLFGLGVLISSSIITTADGQAVVDQEKINWQLEQAEKALDSGDFAAAEGYLKETAQLLPTGESKTHLKIAMNAIQTSNDSKSARMHIQLIENLTG